MKFEDIKVGMKVLGIVYGGKIEFEVVAVSNVEFVLRSSSGAFLVRGRISANNYSLPPEKYVERRAIRYFKSHMSGRRIVTAPEENAYLLESSAFVDFFYEDGKLVDVKIVNDEEKA